MVWKNAYKVYTLMVFTTIIGCLVGLLVFYIFNSGKLSSYVWLSQTKMEGMDKEQARNAVLQFESGLHSQLLNIKLGNDSVQYPAMFLEPKVNVDETMNELFGVTFQEQCMFLLTGHFQNTPRQILPKVEVNEEKLRNLIHILSKKVYKEPKNFEFELQNGIVKLKKGHMGLALDTERLREKIIFAYRSGLYKPIEGTKEDPIVILTEPEISENHLKDIKEVIGEGDSFEVSSNEKLIVSQAVSKMHKQWIPTWEESIAWNRGEFSLLMHMKENQVNVRNEGYNVFARAFYEAILNAGLKKDEVKFGNIENHTDKEQQEILEVRFRNILKTPMVVWAEMKNDKVKVKILGNKQSLANKQDK